MVRIVIPDDYPSVIAESPVMEQLHRAGEVVTHTSLPGSEEELLRRIHGAHSVITIRASTKFTASVFKTASQHMRHVCIWGTGTDAVDLQAARQYQVTVSNTPNTATNSLAEHGLALLLATARRLHQLDAAVRRGEWPRGMLFETKGKTLGIIGTGAIGSRFAELGRGIGMRVIAWTFHPDRSKAETIGFTYVEGLNDLLGQADVISLHLRSTPETKGLIGAKEFDRMKDGAIFVNTARGDIVDEAALVHALRSGKLLGAGLDVFTREPLPSDSPLVGLPNVVLSPHTAGTTPEALHYGLDLSARNIVHFLDTGNPLHRVV